MNAPIKSPDEFAEAKRFLLALSPNGPWALTAIRPFSACRLQSSEFCEASSIPVPPTFIIDSGNGVQALWRIRGGHAEPIIFDEPDDDCKFMGIAEPQDYSRHDKC